MGGGAGRSQVKALQYGHQDAICCEASRRVAYAVFGYMLATPRFQRDVADARQEMRQKLGGVSGNSQLLIEVASKPSAQPPEIEASTTRTFLGQRTIL
jgi:hypothetical protein